MTFPNLSQIFATEIDIVSDGYGLYGPKLNEGYIYKEYWFDGKTGFLYKQNKDNLEKIGEFGQETETPYIYMDILETPDMNSYIRIDPKFDAIIQNSTYAKFCETNFLENLKDDV